MSRPKRRYRQARRARRGAILILAAVLLPVFAIMAAFAVDVAWMQLVRTELRTATDSAARAGAKTLSMRQNVDEARAAAIDAAGRNMVAGEPLVVSDAEVEFGLSVPDQDGRFQFTPDVEPYNAVHVEGLRITGSASGPVSLFFGGVMGVDTFEPIQRATSTMLDRDVCLVIDRSGSMGLSIYSNWSGNGQNCGPLDADTRFAALTEAIDDFLVELRSTYPEEHVAVASYSSWFRRYCGRGAALNFDQADIRQELTDDYSLVEAVMADFMQNGIGGNTAIGEGLRKGIEAVMANGSRPFAQKTIVLMTDGLHNTGVSPAAIAADAAEQDITVHTVTFSPAADRNLMRQVASMTGGQHFHADTAGDLRTVFREIARTLPVLLTE